MRDGERETFSFVVWVVCVCVSIACVVGSTLIAGANPTTHNETQNRDDKNNWVIGSGIIFIRFHSVTVPESPVARQLRPLARLPS